MAHDVFLSHSAHDVTVARETCDALEAADLRVWMAPRNITPGAKWAGEITQAVKTARVMVVIFSSAANDSEQVIREVSCAVNNKVAIIPFRIDAVEPSDEMEYFLGTQHWLDALTKPLAPHVERLIRSVQTRLERASQEATTAVKTAGSATENNSANAGSTGPARRTRACPFCAEQILFDAKLCRFCGRRSTAEVKRRRGARKSVSSAPAQRSTRKRASSATSANSKTRAAESDLYAVIPLRMTAPSLYTASLSDPRAMSALRWVLAVRSPLRPADLAKRVPQMGKLCSAKFVMELVKRAFPGMRLEHLDIPPAGIPFEPGTQYFGIDRAGPCWETLKSTSEVGFYLPGNIPDTEAELIIVH